MKRAAFALTVVLLGCGSSDPPAATPIPRQPPPAASAATVSDDQAAHLAALASDGGMMMGVVGTGAATTSPDASAPPSHPEVVQGEPKHSGGTPDSLELARVLAGLRPRIRACYAAALNQTPDLKGGITLRFVIDKSGTVSSVSNGSSTFPPDMLSCVDRAIQRTTFAAPPDKPVTVDFPIEFRMN